MTKIPENTKLRKRLEGILTLLGHDERQVLLEIAERLLKGQDQYGELDIEHDTRNFIKEAKEELLDAVVYLAIEAKRKERQHAQLPNERKGGWHG